MYQPRLKKVQGRGHWKPEEDDKLKEMVSLHGPQNWNLIAQMLPGRSGKSCRLRWFNQLDPRINKRAFSQEEEERLIAAHRVYGNKWATIAAKLFLGRTDNSVKNQWHVIMARRFRQQNNRSHKPPWNTTMEKARASPKMAFLPSLEGRIEMDAEERIVPPFIDFLGVGSGF